MGQTFSNKFKSSNKSSRSLSSSPKSKSKSKRKNKSSEIIEITKQLTKYELNLVLSNYIRKEKKKNKLYSNYYPRDLSALIYSYYVSRLIYFDTYPSKDIIIENNGLYVKTKFELPNSLSSVKGDWCLVTSSLSHYDIIYNNVSQFSIKLHNLTSGSCVGILNNYIRAIDDNVFPLHDSKMGDSYFFWMDGEITNNFNGHNSSIIPTSGDRKFVPDMVVTLIIDSKNGILQFLADGKLLHTIEDKKFQYQSNIKWHPAIYFSNADKPYFFEVVDYY